MRGSLEHYQKYERLAQRIGIKGLRNILPASPVRIIKALTSDDEHLNTIPLSKWDSAAKLIAAGSPHLSLSECVCLLKHVARYHLTEDEEGVSL